MFSTVVSIREDPYLPRGHASACFDDDGVATRPREVVKDGVLQGYFLGVYSARKLGLRTTANAGGNHNLIVAPGTRDFAGMLKELGTGLLVTELMGQGVNMALMDVLAPIAGEELTLTISGGEFVEVTAAGVTKAFALSLLCADLGIDRSEVVAVGDQPNDLPMLEWAGRGVAMGNAHPAVLDAIAEHTATNTEDGLALVLESLVG